MHQHRFQITLSLRAPIKADAQDWIMHNLKAAQCYDIEIKTADESLETPAETTVKDTTSQIP